MYKIILFVVALSISLILKSSFFQEPLLAQDSGAKQLTTKISDSDKRDSDISGKATTDSENISLETTVSSNFLNIPFLKSENISLEATLSSNFLKVPLSLEDNNINKVEISIRIQNNSQIPQRFTMLDTLRIETVRADGKKDFFGGFRTYTAYPKESECPLLQPGESFVYNFTLYSARHQISDKFILFVPDNYGGVWLIKNLETGEYKIRFAYLNNESESTVCSLRTRGPNPLKDFWTGFAASNFVNLTLGF
jgi:hypothetical protein